MPIKGRNMTTVKQSNRAGILILLQESGGMSRKQLAAALKLTPAAITTIVSELIEEKLVCEGEPLAASGSAGRREITLVLGGETLFAVGISFGIEAAIITCVDLQGSIISDKEFLFDGKSTAKNIISMVGKAAAKQLEILTSEGLCCIGIGVTVRGIVDELSGVSVNSYGAWKEANVPVKRYIERLIPQITVTLKQNVKALAEAYSFMGQDSYESMLFLKNDQGIGSALVFDHKTYAGYRSNAGEIGHIMVEQNGTSCRCGSNGCLETVSSRPSIERDVLKVFSKEQTKHLYNAVDGKKNLVNIKKICANIQDPIVRKILDKAAQKLAAVIRAQIMMLDPQKVVLHGSIFECAYFINKLRSFISFDGRFKNLDEYILITKEEQNLNNLCSAILAIKAFLFSGGTIKRSI